MAAARKEGYWEAAVSDVISALKYKVSQSELLRGAGDTFNSIEPCAVWAAGQLSPKQRLCGQPALNKKTLPRIAHFAPQLWKIICTSPGSLAAALGALKDRLTAKALAVQGRLKPEIETSHFRENVPSILKLPKMLEKCCFIHQSVIAGSGEFGKCFEAESDSSGSRTMYEEGER